MGRFLQLVWNFRDKLQNVDNFYLADLLAKIDEYQVSSKNVPSFLVTALW